MMLLLRFFLPFALVGCASAETRFDRYQAQRGDAVFSSTVDSQTKRAVRAFDARERCGNGKIYGETARVVRMRELSVSELDARLLSLGCLKNVDVIRDPVKNIPILRSDRTPSPLWIWLCDDGSVFRAKPEGDPSSRHRPRPHASKSLRYPCDGPFDGFHHELTKIDDEGNAAPKWPKDLATQDPDLIRGWADDVHFDF